MFNEVLVDSTFCCTLLFKMFCLPCLTSSMSFTSSYTRVEPKNESSRELLRVQTLFFCLTQNFHEPLWTHRLSKRVWIVFSVYQVRWEIKILPSFVGLLSYVLEELRIFMRTEEFSSSRPGLLANCHVSCHVTSCHGKLSCVPVDSRALSESVNFPQWSTHSNSRTGVIICSRSFFQWTISDS